ncbi:hypothetical protein [Ideonella sp. YS5]|uniref:hypothetical protein n=1 Tax=Ideonella sp. YS5 TaxID=3453714 RepID=UPI003EEBD780
MQRYRITFFSVVLVLAHFGSAAATPEVNALWNDKHGFGLWLYDAPRDCTGKNPYSGPFINVGPGGKHEPFRGKSLHNANIALCASFDSNSKPSRICTVQKLELQFDETSSQFFGDYEFTFSDGKKAKGQYRAAYCSGE